MSSRQSNRIKTSPNNNNLKESDNTINSDHQKYKKL